MSRLRTWTLFLRDKAIKQSQDPRDIKRALDNRKLRRQIAKGAPYRIERDGSTKNLQQLHDACYELHWQALETR